MINYILIIMTLWNKQLMHVQEGMDKTSVDQKKIHILCTSAFK